MDNRSTFPPLHLALTSIRPPGASSVICVSGSIMGIIPVSKSTVATQIEFDPDIGGVWFGSIMIQPICAFGFLGGTSKLTCRNRPPRGSLSTKFLNSPSEWINLACSQIVSPGGGATPPTITSPTSPSA